MEKKLVRNRIDFSNRHLITEIQNQSHHLFLQRLGQKNRENAQVYEQSREQGMVLWEQYKAKLMPEGYFVFSTEGNLFIGDREDRDLQAELLVVLQCEEISLNSVLDQYLIHLWQISYLDCVREYLQKLYIKALIQYYCKEEAGHVSPWLGPGLWDMPLDEKEAFMTYFTFDTRVNDDISRKKSFVGGLISTYEKKAYPSPCKMCKATSGCEYCMIFTDDGKGRK